MRTAVLWIVAAILTLGAGSAFAQSCGLEVCDTAEDNAALSAVTQSQSVSDAIGTAVRGRFHSNGGYATQDGGGAASTNLAYWISAAGRSYSGDTSGYQNEGVAGIDVYLSDSTLAGAFYGYGESSREVDGFSDPTVIKARVGGLYFAHQYADSTILHFYAGGGTTDYSQYGTTTDGTRYMAGIDVSKTFERAMANFVPFGKLVTAADDIGDDTVRGTTVTAGGRWEYNTPLGSTQLLPYVSVGVDYITIHPDSSLPDSTTWGPRLEAGFSGPVGPGLLALDLHAAKADEGTSDLGGALTYSFGF